MRCPACGALNVATAKKCGKCKTPFEEEAELVAEIVSEDPPRRAKKSAAGKPKRRPVDDDEYEDEDEDDDDVMSSLVPVRNVMALLAYYFSVFALIPVLGFLLGPLAIGFGIFGLRYASQNPKAKGQGHAVTGIVLGVVTVLEQIALFTVPVLREKMFELRDMIFK